jgi:glycosyltransferase involved in cell wall biosynthesis
MRIALEAAPLALSSGGLARYTAELSIALARCFPDDEYFLVSDQPFRMPDDPPPNLKRGGGPCNAMERRWWLWGLAHELKRMRAQVIHGPDFSVPYIPRLPSVMTLHDLSPWMDPAWHHAAARVRRRTPLLLELGVATMVITPGEAVRRQAIERFRLRPERVVAVPEAAPSWLRPQPRPVAGARETPYFLFVGALEPRKNLPLVVEAWREVRRDHPVDLMLVGRPRPDAPPLREEPGLKLAGEVPDAELPKLYSGALAFVYVSQYEGFGLPVIEAMQCGSCVIASHAVAEAASDAAIYANSAAELVRAMRDVVERPDVAADYRARGLARAAEFSWERTARLTHEVYLEAYRRFGN